MGDPRKLRKQFGKPSHPWQKERIDEEKVLMNAYGFKNKIELWKLNSLLKKWKHQVKELIPRKDAGVETEKKNIIAKLYQYNLIKENAILEDILAVSLKDLCERRLGTLVFRKGLARSIAQARQFITHEHIMIGEKKLTSPSYVLTSLEESQLKIADNSSLASEDNPERIQVQKELKAEMHEAGLKEHTEVVEPKPAAAKKPRKSAKQEMKEEIKVEKAQEKAQEELEE